MPLISSKIKQDLEKGDDEKEDKEVKINPQSVIKPLHKIVAEHKDVVKIAMQLNSIVATIKPEVSTLLKEYAIYDELWAEVNGVFNHSLFC